MIGNENSFTHDGVEYVAVDATKICLGCDFYDGNISCLLGRQITDCEVPSCSRGIRKDGREVIFKKKVNLEMEQEK